MNSETLIAYIAAVAVIVAIPGPNIMLIINDSVSSGFRKSLMTIIGIKAGMSLLLCLSLVGLATLLSLFSWLFTVVKWAGVCYLLYLGFSQIIASLKPMDFEDMGETNNSSFFIKGFLVAATNPKGLFFASAFFPQFLNQNAPIVPQITILCLGLLIVSVTIEIIYAYTGDKLGKIFKTESFKKITARISGVVLIIFGVGLSLAKEKN